MPPWTRSSDSGSHTTPPTSNRRRRTLCTDDGRDIVCPQLPFFPPRPRNARSLRPPAPMTIDVQLAEADAARLGKTVRPLPRIPATPNSAPPTALGHIHSRSSSSSTSPSLFRPLPSVPDSPIAPARPDPLPPTPPAAGSRSSMPQFVPPPPPRRGPPRMSSLRASRDRILAEIPEPPSPRTAQHQSKLKLRRQLGDSVQIVLDSCGSAAPKLTFSHSDSEDDDDSSDEPSEEAYYTWQPGRETTSPISPVSRKWVRERNHKRYTEEDFSTILRDLRNL